MVQYGLLGAYWSLPPCLVQWEPLLGLLLFVWTYSQKTVQKPLYFVETVCPQTVSHALLAYTVPLRGHSPHNFSFFNLYRYLCPPLVRVVQGRDFLAAYFTGCSSRFLD